MRWIALILVLLAASAHAESKRIAVVVGNNVGSGVQPALQFAEADAGKLARVLVEIGGVRSQDLWLLQGRSMTELQDVLARARAKAADYQRAGARVMLMFYFSGHSDGQALELGKERLGFIDLKRWLAATGADVRIALVDSCRSGGLLRVKGGSPGPAFQINLTDELATTGEVLLTSSAADELALESKDLRGSFFTHHLVSGLRGAADNSGDGLVTLGEAYRYAYEHTLRTTGETFVGPQHPAYDYRLSGRGELVLTNLVSTSSDNATLELPRGFERVLVSEVGRDQVVAELTSDARVAIVVKAGRYAIDVRRGGRSLGVRIALASGERRVVRWDELTATTSSSTRTKGGLAEDAPFRIGVAAGISNGVADELGAMPSLRAELRSADATGWSTGATLRSGRGAHFRETWAMVFGGYTLGTRSDTRELWTGVEIGAGAVWQSLDQNDETRATAVAIAGVTAGVMWPVTDHVSLSLAAQLHASVLQRDSAVEVGPSWSTWLGIVIHR
jgi:hypothetical protein